jgi:Fuc2NAc and GlcNAc transferase
MYSMALLALAPAVAVCLLTGVVRRYVLVRAMLDVPNHRSSHLIPTPRGGGLAIGTVALAGVTLAAWWGPLPAPVAAAMLGGGLVIGSVGWIDDARGLGAAVRFAAHLLAASWAVWWLGGFSRLFVADGSLTLGPLGAVLAILFIVWFTNLYNFMDGIDGLAAGEAVFVGLIGGVLLLVSGNPQLALPSFLLSGASAGFLLWNWAPAKIFMGDVGSGLLGYLFGVLALASDTARAMPLLLWVLLFGVFFADATITLVRRMARGEKWYEAHRNHAYQRLVRAGWAHSSVSGAVLLIDLALGVLAAAAMAAPVLLLPGLLIGASLLGFLYLRVERLAPM